jgi:hypothetical protein
MRGVTTDTKSHFPFPLSRLLSRPFPCLTLLGPQALPMTSMAIKIALGYPMVVKVKVEGADVSEIVQASVGRQSQQAV